MENIFKNVSNKIKFSSGACHQNDRDRMREYLISWMSLKAQKYSWNKPVSFTKYVLINVVMENEESSITF